MPRIKVEYTIKATQFIDWPEDEMADLNEDNLFCNLEPDSHCTLKEPDEILLVEVDNEPFDLPC